jgi:subtilisin family serine protease
MTMITLRQPVNADLPAAVTQLRAANPGVAVDYNHLYEWTDSAAEVSSQDLADGAGVAELATKASSLLRVGIIDSAVLPQHRAIRDIEINARDFATAPGFRPDTHGTAVASLVAKSADQQVTIYSASVFFQLPNHAPGSTAESLVAAIDWLVAENVDVINMSLAGPGNQLLEAAIAKLMQLDSTVVVAAVGNNGPSGAPMYPAAYDGVIGVTAVNKRNKIFRYANRGEQVAFAARGVDVKVADSLTGGWRIESGTSMASPHVAVVVAQLRRSAAIRPDAVKSWLIANAEDLGRKGFDPVYGHGLITQPPIVVSLN